MGILSFVELNNLEKYLKIHLRHTNIKTINMNFSMTTQFIKPLFASLLSDGGPTFMYPTLILLIICIALITKGLLKGDADNKLQKLISSISLFALVWGFLGHFIGMIGGMDAISSANDISSGVLAAGIKISLLSPSFGIVVFLIARLGIIALILKEK